MLEKANEYIKRNHIDEKEKSLFHVTPETGWMNDPNGFSVYQGKVHLFFFRQFLFRNLLFFRSP